MDIETYVKTQRANLRITQNRYDYEVDRLETQYPGLRRFYKNKYYVRTARDTVAAEKFLRTLPQPLQKEYLDAASYLFRIIMS
jgi:hypothetical protein